MTEPAGEVGKAVWEALMKAGQIVRIMFARGRTLFPSPSAVIVSRKTEISKQKYVDANGEWLICVI